MSKTTYTPIRWNLTQASKEFGVDRLTIQKALTVAGCQPGKDKAYSTQDIVKALFGDLQSEKIRLTREQADKVALENAISRREYIQVSKAVEIAGRFCFAARQKILTLPCGDDDKRRVLKEFERLAKEDFSKIEEADES